MTVPTNTFLEGFKSYLTKTVGKDNFFLSIEYNDGPNWASHQLRCSHFDGTSSDHVADRQVLEITLWVPEDVKLPEDK